MKIEDTWITGTQNAFCINCKKSGDERRCSWASENKIPPRGAIELKQTHIDTVIHSRRCTKKLANEANTITHRIILCPHYVGQDGAIKPDEFERLKEDALIKMYIELETQRRKAKLLSVEINRLLSIVQPLFEAADELRKRGYDDSAK